jgi:hypothetical protein
MAGRLSLPVEDPDEPDRPKGFRGVDEDTLGPGNHLNREGKKMVLLVYEAFRDDLIRVNTKLVKKRIGESRDKTGSRDCSPAGFCPSFCGAKSSFCWRGERTTVPSLPRDRGWCCSLTVPCARGAR